MLDDSKGYIRIDEMHMEIASREIWKAEADAVWTTGSYARARLAAHGETNSNAVGFSWSS